MHRHHLNNFVRPPLEPGKLPVVAPQESALPSALALREIGESRTNSSAVVDARIASLKILALTLLKQVESLEQQTSVDRVPQLNLQSQVHEFEAAMIKSALAKTGGRQRRAARLLGVKVTTLNTKIKRHNLLQED